jgi:hypothetical protein
MTFELPCENSSERYQRTAAQENKIALQGGDEQISIFKKFYLLSHDEVSGYLFGKFGVW